MSHQHPTTLLSRAILLAYWLALATVTHWPGLQVRVQDQDLGELQVDKLGHVGAFAILVGLLVLARPAGFRASLRINTLWSALIALLYAGADELTQGLPGIGRTASWIDLGCDVAGVLGAAVGILAAARGRSRDDEWPVVWSRTALCVLAPFALIVLFLPGPWVGPLLPMPRDPGRFVLPWRYDWLAWALGSAASVWVLAAARPFGLSRPWTNRLGAVLLVGAIALVAQGVRAGLEISSELGALGACGLGIVGAGIIAAGFLLGSHHARGQAGDRGDRGASDAKAPGAPGLASKPAESAATFVRGATVVGGLTLVSRMTGLLRESVLAAVFGRGPVSDAFIFGFQVPNLFRRLFGEGALSAALVPVYAALHQKDRVTATRFVTLCLGLLLVLLGGLTLLGETVLAGLLVSRSWSPQNELAIRLTMLMLPYMPIVCLVAAMGAILHVHGRFASTAAAPVLLNLFIIGAALVAMRGGQSDAALARGAHIVGLSVLGGGAVQVAWQIVALWGVEPLTRTFRGAGAPMRTLLKRFLPTAIGLGIFQINTFLDNVLAMALRAGKDGRSTMDVFGASIALPLETGDVAALAWAQRLYEFPLGIFGIAIATAIFPALARAGARDQGDPTPQFRPILQHGLRLTVFIGLPAAAGLLLVGMPLVRLIYEHRQFSLSDSRIVLFVLCGYAPAIWAYSMNHVLTRGFYALGDTRTPLYVSTAMVVLNLVLNLTLVWFLGPAGFAWATAFCAIVQCGVLLLVLGAYVERPVDRDVWLGWGRALLLTVLMTAVLWPLVLRFDTTGMSLPQAAMFLGAMVALGAAVYGGGAWVLRAEELGWLVRPRSRVDGS